jgi:hypothetical protein
MLICLLPVIKVFVWLPCFQRRDSIVSIVPRVWAWRFRLQFPAGTRNMSLLWNIPVGCEAWGDTVLRLRINGAILSTPQSFHDFLNASFHPYCFTTFSTYFKPIPVTLHRNFCYFFIALYWFHWSWLMWMMTVQLIPLIMLSLCFNVWLVDMHVTQNIKWQ